MATCTYNSLYSSYGIVIQEIVRCQASFCHIYKFLGSTIVRWNLQIMVRPNSHDGEDQSDLLDM
jgi:hypothetical protein